MRAPQTVIKKPILTEKTTQLRETGGGSIQYAEGEEYAQKIAFEVAIDANKVEIRHAIQKLFKVGVTDVHTLITRWQIQTSWPEHGAARENQTRHRDTQGRRYD